MPYYITGALTFTTTNNRNNARAALDAVPVGNAITWASGAHPAGINNVTGSPGITISFSVEDETEARTFARALFDAYSPYTRNAGHIGTVRGA